MSWCYLFDFELYAKISDELFLIVVSSKISGVLFAHFRTVEPISKRSAFYLWRRRWSKKVPVKKESSHSMDLAIIFHALFIVQTISFGHRPNHLSLSVREKIK